MPRRLMVLSGVTLNQSFVGYLAKLGKHFLGFLDSMHKIGTNAIVLSLLASATTCTAASSSITSKGLLLHSGTSILLSSISPSRSQTPQHNCTSSDNAPTVILSPVMLHDHPQSMPIDNANQDPLRLATMSIDDVISLVLNTSIAPGLTNTAANYLLNRNLDSLVHMPP